MSGRRRDDPIPLGESLQQLVRALRHDDQRPATPATAIGGVFRRWEEAVGADVARHVEPISLDGTTLLVSVDDPGWATQLRFLERTVRERLAEVAGVTVERLEIRVAGQRDRGRGRPARPA